MCGMEECLRSACLEELRGTGSYWGPRDAPPAFPSFSFGHGGGYLVNAGVSELTLFGGTQGVVLVRSCR